MLTIYIPTFNRKECLSRLLKILFNEIDSLKGYDQLIKVHVSDNCSTDGTRSLLESQDKLYFTFSIFDKNVGADENIRNSLNLCTTKFLWILGDDDFPMPGVINFVINTLILSDPKLLYLPAVWSRNPGITEHTCLLNRAAIKLDSVKFVKIVNIKITFISSFILNFHEISKLGNFEFQSLVAGTNFEQLGVFMPHVLNGNLLFVCDSNCINATGNVNFKYSIIKAFGVDLPLILSKILDSRQDLLNIMLNKLLVGFLPGFIANAQKSKDSACKIPWAGMHEQLSKIFLYWIIIAPMRYMPRFISRIWAVFFRFAR
jgi:glycosyltransferase involved in cell wall biosynthesis